MYRFFLTIIILLNAVLPVSAQEIGKQALELSGTACETLLAGESRAGARIRAADKAAFISIKKLEELAPAAKVLNDHDINVMVYRLVDEYVEDMSVHMTQSEDDKVCVEIKGWLDPLAIARVSEDFATDKAMLKEIEEDNVGRIAREAGEEIAIKPDNLQELALVHIADLEFFDGTKSSKMSDPLKKMYADNPYFYLTDDAEIADYVIMPKVLKAKVDQLDDSRKRLHMVVVLEMQHTGGDISGEYQNRYVLFDEADDQQNMALRMLHKLTEQAGQSLLRKIEQNEQRLLEQKVLGRDLSS